MQINKALITAAGPGQSGLPLQRLVDRDGVEKTALEMILGKIAKAGIESVAIVISPGNEDAYRHAAVGFIDRLTFVTQEKPTGYGQAILCARSFLGDAPFLHLVGDHLYLSSQNKGCVKQLIEVASVEGCSVSGVQATRETMLPYFGAIGGLRLPQTERLYEVKRVIEKPTPTTAEQELTIAGFRSGIYLCFFGMHVLTSTTLEILERLVANENRPVSLAEALNELANRERYLACEIQGQRYNIGVKYGLLNTQLALSLSGVDRDRVLSDMVELLASQKIP
ncbi:MAG TPA: sugar phosphate nucleotidyltransferase [Pirellula sp.]|nr:sugar phosphate nucleotidyltransferase [Pirellula sp.]